MIKNILFKILYIFIIIYLIIFIPSITGNKPLVVISGSMEPILKVGGILYYKKIDINEYKKGDILVYKLNKHIISHRIVEIKENKFITKGDNNKSIDPYIVEKQQILGKGTNWSIPLIGYYADFIYNHKKIIILLIILSIINIKRKK